MSEEKQLTVAEILARAQQENPETAKRRRHRRSLEEGGVSVAELTGSIKKVDARPVESKHSSVPIDAPEDDIVEVKPAPNPVAAAKAEAKRKSKSVPVEIVPTPTASAPTEGSSSDSTAAFNQVKPAEKPAEKPVEKPVQTTVVKPAPVKAAPAAAPATAKVEKRVAKPAERDQLDPFAESAPAKPIVVEEDTINPIVLVLLVFLGVIAGILGFLMFQWVWANTAMWVSIALAAVFVVAVVFGVRALRTGKDGLTMTMAGIAAIVASFGPALL